ncbi:DUF4173 domain-containing protein [Candidatus Uhrbacteria bacterium]|nr:DUF4173 domain-containing protein [Candidatus Uhrbacteria bacterium]
MPTPARQALGALFAGILVAVLWEIYVRLPPPTGFALGWSCFLLGSLVVLLGCTVWLRRSILGWPLALAVGVIVLAVDVTLYANPVSDFFGGMGALGLLGVLAYWLLADRIAWARVGWVVSAETVTAALRTFRGIPLMFRTLALREGGRQRWSEVAVGVLLAIPFLFIFGALFASADEAIERMITQLIDTATLETMWHVIRRVVLAFLVAGYLSTLLLLPRPFSTGDGKVRSVRPTVALTFFLLLDVLFVAFVIFEVMQLLRMAWGVFPAAHFTYAGAAHRSFLELVAAGLLASGLGVFWYRVCTEVSPEMRSSRARGAMLGFLGATMAIAGITIAHLLRYTAIYGLTVARAYALLITGALLLGVGWMLMAAVQRVDDIRLGRMLSTGVIVAFVIAMSLPVERFVAEWNVRRQMRGQSTVPLDLHYLESELSIDASPALAPFARSDAATRQRLITRCAERPVPGESPELDERVIARDADWRGWNYFAHRWCVQLSRMQEELRPLH